MIGLIEQLILHRKINNFDYFNHLLLIYSILTFFTCLVLLIVSVFHWPEPNKPQKSSFLDKKLIVAVSLAVTSMLLGYFNLDYGHNWGGDFSQYIAQAMAIADGKVGLQIQNSAFIIENSFLGLGPITYPWGTPLLISPLYMLFGLDLFMFKMIGVLTFGIFVFTIYHFFLKRFGEINSVLLTLLFSVNSAFILYTNQILSDLPFLLLSTLGVIILQRFLLMESQRNQRLFGFLFGAAAAFSFQIRTNGILLILTLASLHILLLLNRLFKKSVYLQKLTKNYSKPCFIAHIIPYITFVSISLAFHYFLPGGGGYHINYISLIDVKTVLSNILYYGNLLSGFFPGPIISYLFYAGSLVCFVYGLLRYYQENLPAVIYSLGTISLLILWPIKQGFRFLFPMIPFYILFAAYGGKSLLLKVSPKSKRLVKLILIYICVLLFATTAVSAYQNLSNNRTADYGAFSTDAVETYHYIRENTMASDVIVFQKPRVLYLNTNRLGFALSDDMSKIWDADYILCSNEDNYKERIDSIQKTESDIIFDLVYSNSKFELFEIKTND